MQKRIIVIICTIFINGSLIAASSAKNDLINIQEDKKLLNLINRISFGADTDEIARIKTLGFDSYLNEQLNPENIDDSEFEARFKDPNSPDFIDPENGADFNFRIREWAMNNMAQSNKQLQEMMTFFWDNHFNTDLFKQGFQWEGPGSELFIDLDGLLFFKPFRKDAVLQGFFDHADIDLDKYDQIVIRMRSKKISKKAKIFWLTDKDLGDEDSEDDASTEEDEESNELLSTQRFFEFKVKAKKGFREYTINTQDNPEWTGRLLSIGIQIPGKRRQKGFTEIREVNLISNANPTDNISLVTDDLKLEVEENEFFRTNAFGNFEDLVKFSAHSPRMLIYLDNWISDKDNPNENYARELLELHTMGVDGGYTQEDVEIASKLFTGWTTVGNDFSFNAEAHDFSDFNFSFINQVASGGEEQGNTFIERVVRHQSTAEFICKKLITYFVNDTLRPRNDPLVQTCATKFLATANADDQIGQVVRTIIESDEFSDEINYRAKIASPLEFIINRIRRFKIEDEDTIDFFESLLFDERYELFGNPVPTGYKEVGSTWLSSSAQLLNRIRFNESIPVFFSTPAMHDKIAADVIKFTDATTDDTINFLLDFFIGDEIPQNEKDFLKTVIPANFDIKEDNGVRFDGIQALLRFILNLPEASFN